LGRWVDGELTGTADTSSPISSVGSQAPPSNAEISAKGNAGKESSVDSPTSPHQPAPAAMVRQYQFFGEDPTEFPDSTIYEIRKVTPGMTEEEKKEIFSVAEYPPDDLHDLTAGTPPDRDFSSAKPTNQVAAATFINYVEPYLRPLTEEDRAFLQERVRLILTCSASVLMWTRAIERGAWRYQKGDRNTTSKLGLQKTDKSRIRRTPRFPQMSLVGA
jgi:hypothetical protein